jgi:anti-sigma regulatory factor (Ser/Thr protein kinase)
VRLLAAADGVEVEFADRGRPFDPTSAPLVDVSATLEERHSGGLGIHLVREIMRDLQYQRTGEWNQISMKRPSNPRNL